MRPALPHGTARLTVGYLRVSTAEQGQSGLGLEAQQACVRAFVEAQGWSLVAEYQDVASGKDDRRPGFQAALARYRPPKGPSAAAAARARRVGADRAAHRLALEVERLQAEVW
ncbi:recombinase family protein [Belnapia sp. T6]|uniref:Recombinase family protein n=1 Tax=Belnapia mucosa TaxID=2804532 RepID=A0ABS1V7S3_9PROT|nr:recombinase family protein [Belnapia mucosa]MBL6457417.1 recombinase family protein [Belnapia mucosa]